MSNFDASKYVEKLDAQTSTPTAETAVEQTTQTNVLSQTETPAETKVEVEMPQTNSETNVKEEAKVVDMKPESNEETPWWEKESTKTESNSIKSAELSEAEKYKKELEDYKARYSQLESIPEVAAIIGAKQSGKEVSEVLKDLVGTDYDKMSPKELFELDLKQKGFTSEEIEELSETFGEKSTAVQKLETLQIKERLKSEQSQKIQQYQSNVPKVDTKVSIREQNFKKAEEEVNNLSSLDGKELYGVTLTKDIIDSVKDAIANKYVMGDEDNGFDIASSFDFHFKAMYTPLIVKANVQKATTKAKESVLNEVTRPDKNITDRPGTETVKDGYQETRGTKIGRAHV